MTRRVGVSPTSCSARRTSRRDRRVQARSTPDLLEVSTPLRRRTPRPGVQERWSGRTRRTSNAWPFLRVRHLATERGRVLCGLEPSPSRSASPELCGPPDAWLREYAWPRITAQCAPQPPYVPLRAAARCTVRWCYAASPTGTPMMPSTAVAGGSRTRIPDIASRTSTGLRTGASGTRSAPTWARSRARVLGRVARPKKYRLSPERYRAAFQEASADGDGDQGSSTSGHTTP
jgi:hypothetical protein